MQILRFLPYLTLTLAVGPLRIPINRKAKTSLRSFEGEGKRFLHGDLICTNTLPEYISDIHVDGLFIISVKT